MCVDEAHGWVVEVDGPPHFVCGPPGVEAAHPSSQSLVRNTLLKALEWKVRIDVGLRIHWRNVSQERCPEPLRKPVGGLLCSGCGNLAGNVSVSLQLGFSALPVDMQ